jgi:hypothetical protein
MDLNISISLDHDSFAYDPEFEVRRILRQVLEGLLDYDCEEDDDVWDIIKEDEIKLRDSFDNTVGTAELKGVRN